MNESSYLDSSVSDSAAEIDVSDISHVSESSFGDSSDISDYSVIIENQKNIIENQHTTNDYLGTILFVLILVVGIYLAYLFGKFVHNLIN